MKVVVDAYIPFLQGVLEDVAQVLYLRPEDITADIVRDADALIIRTRTRCDAALLEGSRVRFIATATIGFDHIDTAYCAAHSIAWVSCPGCNAMAVCEYVREALQECAPDARTIGVIGVGHVGSRVVEMARQRGMKVWEYDPPKGMTADLRQIAAQCDVLTFHTPLTRDGAYPTYHLCDAAVLEAMPPHALLINAARGGVVDEQALAESGRRCVIDCWEGEPDLYLPLVKHATRATCHIAGYSLEGKKNASQMCLEAFTQYFELPSLQVNTCSMPSPGDSDFGWLQRLSDRIKAQPEAFEQIRKNYILR